MATEDIISRLIVSAEERGLDQVAAKMRALSGVQGNFLQVGQQMAAAFQATTKGALSQELALDRLRRQLDPAYKSAQDLSRGIDVLNKNLASGRGIDTYNRNVELLIGSTIQAKETVRDLAEETQRASSLAAQAMIAEREAAERLAVARGDLVRQRVERVTGVQAQTDIDPQTRSMVSASLIQQAEAFEQAERDKAEAVRATTRAMIEQGEESERIARERQTEIQRTVNRFAGVVEPGRMDDSEQRRVVATLAEQGQEYDRLSASAREYMQVINPLGEAEKRHAKAVADVTAMERAGIVTSRQRIQILDAERTKLANIRRDFEGLRGLTISQNTQLGYQLNDIISGLAMGQSPLTVMTQQTGQVVQLLSDSPGGLAGGLRAVGGRLLGLVTPAATATAAIAAVGAAGIVGLIRYENQVESLQNSLRGLGRGSGLTSSQLNKIAEGAADQSKLSRGTAREVAGTFAGTGMIDPKLIGELTKQTEHFAKITGQDAVDAAKELAAAFSTEAAGIDKLNARLNFLNSAQRAAVVNQLEQGNRAEAIRIAMERLQPALAKTEETTYSIAAGWELAWRTINKYVDVAGKAAARAAGGGTLGDQLEAAERVRAGLIGRLSGGITDRALVAQQDAIIAKLREQIKAREDLAAVEAKEGEARRRSNAAEEATKRYTKDIEDVKRLSYELEVLDQQIRDNANGQADLTQSMEARRRIEQELLTLQDDIAVGGKAAADAMRQVGGETALRGLADYERGLQEINNKYNELARNMKNNPLGLDQNEASRAAAIANYNAQIAQQANRTAPIPSSYVDMVRRLESSNRDNVRNQSGPGGTATSSALGAGQFINTTWLRLFRQEFSTQASQLSDAGILALRTQGEFTNRMIEAYAQENAVALRKLGIEATNLNLYLAHHFGAGGAAKLLRAAPGTPIEQAIGAGAVESNPYLRGQTAGSALDILARKAGAGAEGVYQSQERVRALQAEGIALGAVASRAEQLRAAEQYLNQEREKGTDIGRAFSTAQDVLTGSVEKLTPELQAQVRVFREAADAASRAVASNQALRLTQDLQFERAQMFRTPMEQAVEDRLRGTGLTSDSMQAGMIRMNDALRTIGDTGQQAFNGILQGLQSASSGAEIFASALQPVQSALNDILSSMLRAGLMKGLGSAFESAGFSGFGASAPAASATPALLPFGGPRAGGGTVMPGNYYRVGESGPENFVPFVPGAITRNGAGGGGAVTVEHVVINNSAARVSTSDEPDGRGGRRTITIIDEAVAAAADRPGSETARSLAGLSRLTRR